MQFFLNRFLWLWTGCSYYPHCVTPVTLNKISQPQGVDYKVYWFQGLPHPLSVTTALGRSAPSPFDPTTMSGFPRLSLGSLLPGSAGHFCTLPSEEVSSSVLGPSAPQVWSQHVSALAFQT